MDSQSRPLKIYGLVFLFILTLAGLGWVNYRYASEKKGGSTFLFYWIGTRALITEGKSPYGESVATDVQKAIQERSGDNPQPLRVTYPFYSTAFFLPFALFQDETIARTLWMLAQEIGLVLFALACIRLTRWRLSTWNLPLYIVFILTWFHSLIVLHEGNDVILVALLLAWTFLAVRDGHDELGGLLLALSAIRPLAVLLPVIFLLLWAGVQKRWKLVAWFVGSLVLLVLGSMFFVQDWLLQNIQAVLASLKPPYPMTPGAAFIEWWPGIGSRLGWILTALLGLILLAEWWMAVRAKEFRWFLWTACLTLVITQWIGIRTEPGNYIQLLMPLTLVFAVWDERWRRNGGLVRTATATVASMLLLELGPWAIYWEGLKQGQNLSQMPALLFPLPFFLLITMYWLRWWAIRTQRLYVETLHEQEMI